MTNEFMKQNKSSELTIKGSVYTVSLFVSMEDLELLEDNEQDLVPKSNQLIATIIHNHLSSSNSRPLISEIQEDSFAIGTYIEVLLNANESIKKYYDKLADEQNNCIRLLKSIILSSHESMEKSFSTIKDTLSKVLFSLPDQNNVFQTIQKALEPLVETSRKIGEMILSANEWIVSLVEKIKIPSISDEDKEQLRKSFTAWGKFGWTIFPYAPLNFYNEPPKSQKEANEKACIFCSKKHIDSLISDVRLRKGINKRDFEEAVFDFNHHQYKSCAMILLSLIDAKLIRMQKKEDRKKNGDRKNGIAAINRIEKRIERESDVNSTLLFLLYYSNIFACLKEVFEYGNDFKTQPDTPNRNFISHGMLTRKVLKRDCVQLFLLYYNFIEFIDILKD